MRVIILPVGLALITIVPHFELSAQVNSATDHAGAIEWVTIPAGEFTMGIDYPDDPGNRTAHAVYLDEYEIAKYEVTVGQFRQFVEETGFVTEAEEEGLAFGFDGETWTQRTGLVWQNPGFEQTENHPVVFVTRQDAEAFCAWLSEKTGERIRLPTDAEWEKAARGGDERMFPWGFDTVSGKLANIADVNLGVAEFASLDVNDGYRYTSPVGSYPAGASPFGVMDLVGNAWEWVSDYYSEDYFGRTIERNPTGPESGPYHMTRGASWGIGGPFADRLKCTFRNPNTPGRAFDVIGFRVVREM